MVSSEFRKSSNDDTKNNEQNPWDSVVGLADNSVNEEKRTDSNEAEKLSIDDSFKLITENGEYIEGDNLGRDIQAGDRIEIKPISEELAEKLRRNDKEREKAAINKARRAHIFTLLTASKHSPENWSRALGENVDDLAEKRRLMDYGFYEIPPAERHRGSINDDFWESWKKGWSETESGGKWLDEKVKEQMRKDNTVSNSDETGTGRTGPVFAESLMDTFSDDEAYDRWGESIAPYIDKIRSPETRKQIEEIVDNFDPNEYGKLIVRLVNVFVGVYGLKNYPTLCICGDDYKYIASMNELNELKIGFEKLKRSDFSEVVDTIAHELFHARQAQAVDDNEPMADLYRINDEAYIMPSEDYNKYQGQLVEAQAWMLGDCAGSVAQDVIGDKKQQ